MGDHDQILQYLCLGIGVSYVGDLTVPVNGRVWASFVHVPLNLNPPGTDTEIFWENYDTTIDADALARCVARSSAIMVFHMQDKWAPVFHEEGFQLWAPS